LSTCSPDFRGDEEQRNWQTVPNRIDFVRLDRRGQRNGRRAI